VLRTKACASQFLAHIPSGKPPVLMIMQLNVKFEKEQNGTLFVRKGQWLGPFGEGGGSEGPD
jgi:hypothetical protein